MLQEGEERDNCRSNVFELLGGDWGQSPQDFHHLQSSQLQSYREQSPRLASYLTAVTSLEFPKLLSSSVICWKDPQNSLKVVILRVMIYYSERIQINISQGKNPEDIWMQSFFPHAIRMLCSPGPVCDSTHRVLLTRGIHPSLPQCSEFILGLHYVDLIDWLIDWLLTVSISVSSLWSLWAWSKAPANQVQEL